MKFSITCSLGFFALSHLALAAENSSSVVLGLQLGPYPVAIYDHEVKTSRPDPLAPTPQDRRLMITIYRPFLDNSTCPTEFQQRIPYISPVVASALFSSLFSDQSSNSSSSDVGNSSSSDAGDPSSSGIAAALSSLQLVNCSRAITPSTPSGPLVLFSHGAGGVHQGYASILMAAASSGYTVVAIDHTYEAAAVVFPDGTVATASDAASKYESGGIAGGNFLAAVRDNDTISVLDAIEHDEVPGLTHCANSSSKTKSPPLRAVMYGHSLGGSTAVNAALLDPRIVAAASLEGPDYAPAANGTMRKPLLMMQAAESQFTSDWSTYYKEHVAGWKTWVRVNGTEHYSYTDLPLLADLAGLRGTALPDSMIGAVDGRRLQEIVWRYTTHFFDFAFHGKDSELLTRSSTEFPDVDFVAHA